MLKKIYHCERKEFKMKCFCCCGKERCKLFTMVEVDDEKDKEE